MAFKGCKPRQNFQQFSALTIWFGGEPDSRTPLLPTLYRENLAAYENPLLQMFRQRASGYHDVVPDVERTDQWLFLAQHAGVPTRLLDWTEGAPF